MQCVRLLFKVKTNGTIGDKINNTLYETLHTSWLMVFVFYLFYLNFFFTSVFLFFFNQPTLI